MVTNQTHVANITLRYFIGTKESVYILRKEFNSHRISLEHQHGGSNVMWKLCIILCFLTFSLSSPLGLLKLFNVSEGRERGSIEVSGLLTTYPRPPSQVNINIYLSPRAKPF